MVMAKEANNLANGNHEGDRIEGSFYDNVWVQLML